MEPTAAAAPDEEKISGTVLVVDDEENIVTLLTGWIETTGCDVVSASNGEEALEQARQHAPDVILMDCMMPRMSGFDACREMKQDPELKDIPVIFLTVRNEVQDVVNGLELGAHGYMTKPFKPQELLARVRSVLRIKKLQDRLKSRTRELRSEWTWVSAVMEQLPVGLAVLDAGGRVTFWNDVLAGMTSIASEQALGKPGPEMLSTRGADLWEAGTERLEGELRCREDWVKVTVLRRELDGEVGGLSLVIVPA